MSYPCYRIYKNSGIEWLGEIPQEWILAPLKRGFAVKLGKMLQTESSSNEDELSPYLRAANIQRSGVDITDVKEMWFSPHEKRQLTLQLGDLLVSEGGDVGRSAVWNNELPSCCFQNAINRIRSTNSNSTKYLHYWIIAIKEKGFIDLLCNKATIAHFTAEKVEAVPVLYPSLTEQHVIAYFLDRETGKIDGLIHEQEQLIVFLKEERQAVISHAITKGLDLEVPMKNSGIEWLGDIPVHWDIERSKWLLPERDERSKEGQEELLTVSHLTGVTPRSEKDVNMFMAESLEGYKICEPGDLVINTLWAWMGAMGTAPIRGIVSPAYNVYRPTERLDPAWLDLLVRIPVFIQEVTRYSKGIWSSRLRLYPEGLYETYLPVPPLSEQRAIVDYVGQELARIDDLISDIQEAIERLKEYRSALITDAVTGKIDVRSFVEESAT